MGNVLVLSAALASQTNAVYAANRESICYSDGICLELRGTSGASDGKVRIIGFTQNEIGVGSATINCDKMTVVITNLASSINITLLDAQNRTEQNFDHFCAP
jgi:hypothetical protein